MSWIRRDLQGMGTPERAVQRILAQIETYSIPELKTSPRARAIATSGFKRGAAAPAQGAGRCGGQRHVAILR